MTTIEIIFGILGFIPAVFLAFYIPGKVILNKLELPVLANFSESLIIGIVLWALQGVIFGYIHSRWLSYLYLLFFLILFIKSGYFKLKIKVPSSKIDIFSLFLVIAGIVGQTFPYWRMGWETTQGIIISGHNTADHVWHAALVKELIRRFPPNEPAISGVILKDYHYFYNLVAAEIIRVFHLPFFTTQFIGLYALAPIILGLIGYSIAQNIWDSRTFTRLFLFLLYFGGNASGWVMLIMRHTFNWNLSSLINDSSKFMDSPPYGYAVIIGLGGFYLLLKHRENFSNKLIFICALLFGTLFEFKIYIGIPFLIGFGLYSLFLLLRKNFRPFVSFTLASVTAALLLKVGSSSTSGLIFLPVDIPRDFINQPLLQLKDWQFRWIIYQNHHSLFRLIQYGAMMSGLYLVIQFGLQLLGFFPFFTTIRKLGLANSIFLFSEIIAAFIFGLFFYQTVGGANIWEFFLASTPFLSLSTSIIISYFLLKKPKVIRAFVLTVFVIITIPQWLISVQTYFRGEFLNGFHGISRTEAASYKFISKKTPSNSLIFIASGGEDSYASVANLFMDRDIYLSGNGVRQIITPEILKRREEIALITSTNNFTKMSAVLKGENISYVYFYGKPTNIKSLEKANLKLVFANSASTIFQVR